MHSFDSLTTLIFAIVAIAVIWKLRSVLGERTGSEKPPGSGMFRSGQSPGAPGKPGDNVVRLPSANGPPFPAPAPDVERWRGVAEPGTPIAQGLDAIAAADPSFSARPFLDGAKAAYEMIITAFAAGERKALQGLLARDVYDSFAAVITDREKRKEVVSSTLVSIDGTTIEEARMDGRTARIAVRFTSKLITATHDAAGTLVDGSPDQVVDMNDVWSFARDTTAKDPNWTLVATESGH